MGRARRRYGIGSVAVVLAGFLAVPAVSAASAAAPGGQRAPGQAKQVEDSESSYLADGRKVGLNRRTDRIVVAFEGADERDTGRKADAAVARLTRVGGPLADFRQSQRLAAGVRVLQNDAASRATDDAGRRAYGKRMRAAIASAAKTSDVSWAAGVYTNVDTGTTVVATDEVIVALKPGQDAAAFFAGDARFSGYRPLLGTPDQFVGTVAAGGGEASLELAAALAKDRRLAWASPNFYQELDKAAVPNDPLYPQQWHLNNTGQAGGTPDADVDAPEAWDIVPGGSPAVVVAIIDDGMEYSHPDLAPNLFTNPGETAGNGIDDDGNGWVDDVNGWDFTSNDNFPGASSVNDAHATSVGGVAAAAGNNGAGVAGIAYRSRLLPVRIFGDTGFATTDANIASAVYYAAGRTADGLGTWPAADILNNSWGGGGVSTAITAAFTWASTNGRGGKGAVSFISTGNDFGAVSYPANLADDLTGVIAVGASTNLEVRATYSNSGPEVDFVAPSNGPTYGGTFGIVTVDRVGANGYNPGDYTTGGEFGGTSSAAPLAAGIGALVLAERPDLTALQVRGLMRNTTDFIGPLAYPNGRNNGYGHGRVNAARVAQGIGVAEVELLDGRTIVTSGDTVSGFVAVTSQTATRTLRVRNQGTEDLTLGGLTISGGGFGIGAGFTDTVLGAGEVATFDVAFSPTSGGAKFGTLRFTTNDADEPVIEVGLSGTALVTSIAGHVFEDWDADGARESGEPTLPGQVVYLDLNDDQVLDTSTFSSSPNLAIPDNNPTGATSMQVVAGQFPVIGDVDVTLDITHTFVGDLEVRLTSPAGTVVPLILRRGGSGDNFTNTVLDDEAGSPISGITSARAPFTGRFRPESPLSALDGQDPNGTWQLAVSDRAGADVGTLRSWSLAIVVEPTATSGVDGSYGFLNVAPGTYSVRSAPSAGWVAVSPASGSHAVVVVDADTQVTGRDFGLARANAIYGQAFDDANGDGVRDAGEPGAAGWQVYLDRDGDGVLTPDAVFTANPALPIPDNNPTGATSTQVVAGQPTVSGDVDVTLGITHTFVGDLEVRLTSPAGTVVPLILRRGGSGDNFTNTVLDDEAASPISGIAAAAAPFTGRFRPESPLSVLDGQDPNGTWQLNVADRAAVDVGTLQSWTLRFEREPVVVTPASGNYQFTNLAPGVHLVRQVDQVGWRPTAPTGGVHTVTLAAGGVDQGNDFGNVADSTPPTVDVVDVSPDPRTTSVASVDVSFSEAVTGFDLADVSLTRDGAPVALSGASVTGSGAAYTVTGLGTLTSPIGVYALSVTAAGSGVADLAGNALATDASDTWTHQAATSLLYTGSQIVNVGSPLSLSARLSSPAASCIAGKTVTFTLDADPLTGAPGPYLVASAVTSSTGVATAASVPTTGWLEGVYTLTATFAGAGGCVGSTDEATLTVAAPGQAATGGGWYTLAGAGRVNFGFTVRAVPNSPTYKGQLVVVNNGKWRLKATLDRYSKTSTGNGAASGVGDLFWWDATLAGGLGDWRLAQAGVSFTASFFDSAKTGKASTDKFGIRIVYTPVSPQPSTLPNSTPMLLKGGDIKVL